ncbi:MAG: exopolysaccharide biosynthesis protein [Candidatus Scalindua rubra]|uniref:Exopolysaccharide biosynthesis protein n=1 Tax=Candidatus Scalindua rubra TaxID=1872076 RepID=A0A1E3X5P9_9BACT|nr:MAG: exopolysaccharide biosynthesis protein [Candidatus Scalindua rubra]
MEQENTSFDIHKYIKLLLRRKWLWIIPTILFSIGSTIYALILPDVYESKCVLIVERSKVLNNLLSENERGMDARKLLQAVRERMLGWQSVIQVIKIVELDKDIPQNDPGALEKRYYSLLKNTTLKTKGQNLIEVSYRGENPEINFRVVDGLVSNFMEHSLKSTRTEADETVEFVEEDLRRLKRNLDESERQLREFEEEHLEELPGSANSKISKLSAAEKELAETNREIMVLNEKFAFLEDHMKKENKTITGEVIRVPNPKVGDLRDRINKLEIQVNSLRAKYFDKHPGIVQRLKELDSLKEMLEKESEKIVSEEKIVNNPMYENLVVKEFDAQLKLKSLQRRRKEIESTIASLQKMVKGMPALKQELIKLKRDNEVNKQLYEQRLLQKSKAELMREMSLDAKTNPFNIVEPARISYEPIKAVKIKIIAMGVIMGLGLGVGLIFGLEQIDQRFKTMDEVQGYLNIPALGIIPTILTKTDIKRKFKKRIIMSGSLATFIIVTATVCLVVEPVKTIVSDKANVGWGKLVELIKK